MLKPFAVATISTLSITGGPMISIVRTTCSPFNVAVSTMAPAIVPTLISGSACAASSPAFVLKDAVRHAQGRNEHSGHH